MSEHDQKLDARLARVHPSRRAFIRQGLIGTTTLALGVASSTLLAQASENAAGKAKGTNANPRQAKGAGKGKGQGKGSGAGQ